MPRKDRQEVERMTVVLPKDVATNLRALAAREGIPHSVLIRNWVMEHLRRREGEQRGE